MSAVADAIQTEMPVPILFTDSAAAKVADLIAEEGNPELKLRVFEPLANLNLYRVQSWQSHQRLHLWPFSVANIAFVLRYQSY